MRSACLHLVSLETTSLNEIMRANLAVDYSLFLAEIAANDTFLNERREVQESEANIQYTRHRQRLYIHTTVITGCFPPYLVSAIIMHSKFFLPRVIEVIEKPSAWEISSYIRQFLYGFTGASNAKEIVHEDCFPKISEKLRTQKLQSKSC